MSADHPDPWIAKVQAKVHEWNTDAAVYTKDYASALKRCARDLAALLTERAASPDWPKLTPEDLDAECHCGNTPEGDTVWGTNCPVIEHRARSGKQWRDAYVKQDAYVRVQLMRAESPPVSPADPPHPETPDEQ